MITVDYAQLVAFQGRMRGIYQDIETQLNSLSAQVERLLTTWEGAAAEGFEASVRSWQQAAADLQERLVELHNMVGRAHDNQAAVVRSNTRMWSARRGG